MTDTLDKRVYDLEFMLAHLPQDLDARFAGVDARMGGRFDQINIRLQAMNLRIGEAQQALATQGAKLDVLAAQIAAALQHLPKP